MASMVAKNESALICDFAETYHLFDYRALPLRTAATLAAGLHDDSRIKMAMTGQTVHRDTLLLAAAVDRLSLLVWAKTKDAERGANKPKSILGMLTQQTETQKDKYETFETAEDFEAARKAILQGGG